MGAARKWRRPTVTPDGRVLASVKPCAECGTSPRLVIALAWKTLVIRCGACGSTEIVQEAEA